MVEVVVPQSSKRSHAGWLKLGCLMCAACVQLWTQGSLTSYAVELREATERHAALQAMLREAEARMRRMKNETRGCETLGRDKASAAGDAKLREVALQQQIDLLQEDNEWLNHSVIAKEEGLRTEQSMRIQLEASVHSLKEQMSLMQGQLVTAQQQQGTLHKKAGRRH
mmetsp:Transcript_7706/g.15423  ORF Transcript_7706/g.15423 Transcript_7706/m.15423 type:complete len:168 (-) Transcript_7706:301-804(-)